MSAVHFRCTNCDLPIMMGRSFWGKRVKCKRCATVLTVPYGDGHVLPTRDAVTKHAPGPETQIFHSIGLQAIVVTTGVLIICGMLLWAFFLRDTWEQDHSDGLTSQVAQAEALLSEGQDQRALAAFRTVIANVGDHRIDGADLSRAVNLAKRRITEVEARQDRERKAAAERKLELARQKDDAAELEAARKKEEAREESVRKWRERNAESANEARTAEVQHEETLRKGATQPAASQAAASPKAEMSMDDLKAFTDKYTRLLDAMIELDKEEKIRLEQIKLSGTPIPASRREAELVIEIQQLKGWIDAFETKWDMEPKTK